MILIVIVPLLFVAGFLMFRLFRKVFRLFMQVVTAIFRAVAALAAAGIVAVAIGIAAFFLLPVIFLEDWFGILVPGLALLGFIIAFRQFAHRRERGSVPRGFASATPIPAAASPVEEEAQIEEEDSSVAAAWNLAVTLAPEHRMRLRTARETCARVHEMAVGDSVEWSIIDCSTFISRTVPDVVMTAAALIREAEPSERAELTEELVANLERLAIRARREVDGRRRVLRNRWRVIKTHIANRTAPEAS